MRRVQAFLECDEVQKTIKDQKPDDPNNPNPTVLSIKGNFSWGFTAQKTKDKKPGAPPKNGKLIEEEKKDENPYKSVKQYLTLRDINIDFYRGEFVCVIGDVGAGKSSLLNSVIGDLLYVSDQQVSDFGGIDKEGSPEEFDTLKKTVLETEV